MVTVVGGSIVYRLRVPWNKLNVLIIYLDPLQTQDWPGVEYADVAYDDYDAIRPAFMDVAVAGLGPDEIRLDDDRLKEVTRVRSFFPETWLWESTVAGWIYNRNCVGVIGRGNMLSTCFFPAIPSFGRGQEEFMPDMAMEFDMPAAAADSAGGGGTGGSLQEVKRVRSFFPETWLFTKGTAG
uniref:Uncharacterized protein n=1 Tax=Branchiostoma floridae TaxID=7739 RepID=C3XUC1_BRAFL|eukprot:XP_002612486.1 hypothetical protein BRAFLDRAFT_75400 [Branchiostoma floridae]